MTREARMPAEHDDAHVAAFVFRARELRGDGDEDLRDDGTDTGHERGSPDDVNAGSHADGEQGKDEQDEVGEDDFFPAAEVSQRNDEEQAECIADLGHHGDDVGPETGFAQIVPDEIQQGLVVVLVGDGDAGYDGECPEDVGRQSGVFCQVFVCHILFFQGGRPFGRCVCRKVWHCTGYPCSSGRPGRVREGGWCGLAGETVSRGRFAFSGSVSAGGGRIFQGGRGGCGHKSAMNVQKKMAARL